MSCVAVGFVGVEIDIDVVFSGKMFNSPFYIRLVGPIGSVPRVVETSCSEGELCGLLRCAVGS